MKVELGMEDEFEPYQKDLQALKPQVKERAIAIAGELRQQGQSTEAALKEAIKRAEAEFLAEEG
jgi:hypothetical protein